MKIILSLTILFTSILFANNDSDIINFEKNRIKNPQVKVIEVKINTKQQLPSSNWFAYILDVKVEVNKQIKEGKDILFSNGKYISLDLLDPKNGKSFRSIVSPRLTNDYYNKEKLIAGNHKAKDKIVVFSDPLCPFCMDYIPDVINHVNNNSDSIALYYYHFPLLRIHPASDTLSKLMEVSKTKNIKNVELKVYKADWDKYFDSKSKDEKKILNAFNKELKTDIKLEEIMNKEVAKLVIEDIKMGEELMVRGTPTIYINGKKDNTRLKFEMLGK